MNLQTEITAVRHRIGEPFRSDEQNGFILDKEIRQWIHEAELQVVKDLPDDALYTLHKPSVVELTGADNDYDLPTDFVRWIELRIKYDGTNFYSADLVSPKQFRQAVDSPMWRANIRKPKAMIFNNKFYIAPTPETTVASGIELRYVKEPTRRYKHYKGLSTAAGSTTTVVDSETPGVNDYWNATELVLLDGTVRGQSGIVTGFTDASGTFTFAASTFTAAPGVGVDFEVGQISDLPGEFFPLWVAWASWLALSKDREVDLAREQKLEYTETVGRIRERYEGLHRAEPTRETAR